MWSHQGNCHSSVHRCAVTCGCPHPLSPGWQWVMDRLAVGYWQGHQLCAFVTHVSTLHYVTVYVFVPKQQRQTYLWPQGIVVHDMSFNVHDGYGTAGQVFLQRDLVTQQTYWDACDSGSPRMSVRYVHLQFMRFSISVHLKHWLLGMIYMLFYQCAG